MRYLTLILGILALTLPGATAQDKDGCQQFTGTIKASLVMEMVEGAITPVVYWLGTAEVTIGKSQPLTGTTKTVTNELLKGDPLDPTRPYSGRETTTITLEEGGTIVLETRFVVPTRRDPTVWWVNETGSITSADVNGMFAAIHGRVTIHGPFGPGVPQPKPEDVGVPEGATTPFGWIGEIRGNICGVVK